MPEPVKVNVVSYGGVKPGQLIVGNGADGTKTTLFDAATATNGTYVFYQRTGLTAWNVDLPKLENGGSMFYQCTGLTAFSGGLPNLTNGQAMFQFCSALTAFSGGLPNLTNGGYMFNSCSALTSWNVELPKLTSGDAMFRYCTGLTTWTADLPKLENGGSMFQGCNLDAPSVIKILTTIPDRAAAGLAEASLHIGKKTNYEDNADVAALLGTVTPIAAGTYSYKGWAITVQN